MIKTGAEKKSMVCKECTTLMTPTAYNEHNGLCQLCRDVVVGDATIWVFTYSEGEQTDTAFRVYDTDDDDEALELFTRDFSEEYGISDDPFEWAESHMLRTIGPYDIVAVRRSET